MKIIIAIITIALISCAKTKPAIKKPQPITYGDPRNNIIDTVKTSN